MSYYDYLKKIIVFLISAITVFSLCGTIYFIADIENIDYKILRIFTNADLCLLILMIIITVFQIIKLTIKNTEKSKLRTKVILMFAFLSICPTIAITAFSSLFFNYGMKSWFNHRVSQALENSVTVAEAYLKEHANLLSMEAVNLAQEISNQNLYDTEKLNEIINLRSHLRNLTEVVILKDNTIIAKSKLSFSITFDRIPIQFLQEANLGEIVVFTSNKEEKVRALIRIDGYQSVYLLISRPIDRKTIKHVASTKIAVNSYLSLKKTINAIQLQFFLLFILISLLLVLFSIWCAIHFSNDLLYSIIKLAHATKRVASGDLNITVVPSIKKDEIADLTNSFNEMTKTLKEQRQDLIATNEDLSKRHIFIKTILEDLSSGVIVLDINMKITLMNNIAQKLFNASKHYLEENIFFIIPEIRTMLHSCIERHYIEEKNIEYKKGSDVIHLLIRVSTINYNQTSVDGYIITFDDISKLVSAQKALMWSEVAKRIAHEIKNPITPIYLATERLEVHLKDKSENIIKYLKIIQRNVLQIRSIINEFAYFARLPMPIFTINDIHKIIISSVNSMEIVFPNVTYTCECSAVNTAIKCDGKQLSGLFDNIIRNSCEAMSTTKAPRIDINISEVSGYINISIKDNGIGFPKDIINVLTDPYVTTKPSGTGLGLAIVKKIIDEHHGKIEFKNLIDGGGFVLLCLPINF